MSEPVFDHDCAKCVYLGRLELEPSLLRPEQRSGELGDAVVLPGFVAVLDLYFCRHHFSSQREPGKETTVVARIGNEVMNYKASNAHQPPTPELAFAARLAHERGLLSE